MFSEPHINEHVLAVYIRLSWSRPREFSTAVTNEEEEDGEFTTSGNWINSEAAPADTPFFCGGSRHALFLGGFSCKERGGGGGGGVYYQR